MVLTEHQSRKDAHQQYYHFEVESSDTIDMVKQKIQNKEGMSERISAAWFQRQAPAAVDVPLFYPRLKYSPAPVVANKQSKTGMLFWIIASKRSPCSASVWRYADLVKTLNGKTITLWVDTRRHQAKDPGQGGHFLRPAASQLRGKAADGLESKSTTK